MPYFDCLPTIAARVRDAETVAALKSIRVRLARALDRMIAALSNPMNDKRRADVPRPAAEAFDRHLLYLAAAFDIYGRQYPLRIDPTGIPRSSAVTGLNS